MPDHFVYRPTNVTGYGPETFQGTTAITFNVTNPTQCIVLHAKNLTFSSISLKSKSGGKDSVLCSNTTTCAALVQPVTGRKIETTFDQNLVYLNLGDTKLGIGSKPVLTTTYEGIMRPEVSALGLHHSAPFATCSGSSTTECEKDVLVTTQLEPTGARSVFPGYDGPAYKAEFTTTVVVCTRPAIVSSLLA